MTSAISTILVSTTVNGTSVSLNGLASGVDDNAIITAMLSIDQAYQRLDRCQAHGCPTTAVFT